MQIYSPGSVLANSGNPDQEIPWQFISTRWRTVQDLKHRSNPATGDIVDSTWSLYLTDFGIQETNILGLKFHLVAQRNGRIVDQTIQLCYQNQLIGVNKVDYTTDTEGHLPLSNDTAYGGPEDVWGVSDLGSKITDPSFGIVIKFQSHPYYPHSCGLRIDQMSLTVYSE
jgi:hypothetical protein